MDKPKQPNGPVLFPQPEDMGPRDWGKEEVLFVSPGKYSFKKLTRKKGAKGGLQYHHKKHEGGFVVSGQMLVRYDDGSGKLVERICGPGDVVEIPQGAVHQEEAVTDCVVIEVSTPYFNDRVRVEEQYGLPLPEGGLPSTAEDEVEER